MADVPHQLTWRREGKEYQSASSRRWNFIVLSWFCFAHGMVVRII